MKMIHTDSYASMDFKLTWKSPLARHTEGYWADRVNMWRDLFPQKVRSQVMGQAEGDQISVKFSPGEGLPAYRPEQTHRIQLGRFDRYRIQNHPLEPRRGRYYPKGVLKDMPNIFKENMAPFRCGDVEPSYLTAEFNHPLAGKDLQWDIAVHKVWEKKSDTGGGCADWLETIADGPGMQARWNGKTTDFFSDDPFRRADENPDGQFYAQPRFVRHIDERASAEISNLYALLIPAEADVLDLMSSWTSHLPENQIYRSVTGLGMNLAELEKNSKLTRRTVWDLNQSPEIPYADGSFDAVLCAASIEYLTDPFAVFRETRRVLKPGGLFIIAFSNRWFPPKAVKIWTEIHEFERMGLVMEYFLQTEGFGDLQTWSMRGLPRPEDDKYYGQIRYSDPVYAVWGAKTPHPQPAA